MITVNIPFKRNPTCNIQCQLKILHALTTFTLTDSFYFSIKVLGGKGLLQPGGDIWTSEDRGDLGAAQAEYPGGLDQHQKQMGKRALGTK